MDQTQNHLGIIDDIGYQLLTDSETGNSLRLGVNLEYPEEGINISLISFDEDSEIVESLGASVPLEQMDDLAEYFYQVSQMLKHFQPPGGLLQSSPQNGAN
jgi:hypothetical protein